ncbi:hypothetical protein [Streptomyces ficellus]|uniref:Uncharacterized protein n=1 Tax=Streptomyces ficellus TaxID=1977088 RepID=A0A6I6F8V8_9ACTN|nr:hypothetical protein [Streptomyces ficellus]QGV79471.1 hypothetical protein EIZ62_15375 [Streptomyces ficellus]
MADIHELTLALDLRDELPDAEVAELLWHLGLGARPETPVIVPSFGYEDEDDPAPLLADHGAAHKVGGALTSALVRRPADGWALASRQEIHPDQFDEVGALLTWLAARATDRHARPGDGVHLGWIRFYDSDRPEPLVARDGTVEWPS